MFFGVVIITIVYIPILALTGIEGKMFHPMALTVMLALAGALVLALTLMPVLCSFLLRGRIREGDNLIIRVREERLYAPSLRLALRCAGSSCSPQSLFSPARSGCSRRLGAEFVPKLDEGSITVHALQAGWHEHGGILADRPRGRKSAACRVPRNHARIFAHRHERNRDRSDAAERERRLHLLQAAERMAEDGWPATQQGGVARAHRGDAEEDQSETTTFCSPSRSKCVSTKCSKGPRPNCR